MLAVVCLSITFMFCLANFSQNIAAASDHMRCSQLKWHFLLIVEVLKYPVCLVIVISFSFNKSHVFI